MPGQQRTQSGPELLRGVVVGCGMGGSSFIQGLAEMDGFELAGAVDLDESVLQTVGERFGCRNLYTDYTTCFAELQPDIVCVHTYPPTHHLVVEKALEHSPRGLITDKPLGDTVEHGQRIVDSIKSRGLPVQVPHGHAIKPAAAEALDRVWNGDIGVLRTVEIQCDNWDIISAGIHWLHYFATLIHNEPVDWVMCATESSTRTYRDGMQVGTTEVTYIQTKKGERCIMHTGDETLVHSDFESLSYRIVGSDGIVEWGLGGPHGDSYFIQGRRHPTRERITPGYQRSKLEYLEALARQIADDQPDYGNIEASLYALQLVCGAYLSSRYQQKICIPWNAEEVARLERDEPFWAGIPYEGRGGGRDGKTWRG